MTLLDAPNQQVVRPDGSAPWDEGDGGSTHTPPSAKPPKGKAAKSSEHEDDTDAEPVKDEKDEKDEKD